MRAGYRTAGGSHVVIRIEPMPHRHFSRRALSPIIAASQTAPAGDDSMKTNIASWGCASVLCSAAMLAPLLVDTDRLGPPATLEVTHTRAEPIGHAECRGGNAARRPIVPPAITPHRADCLMPGQKMADAR
jgi:hypothetical protein